VFLATTPLIKLTDQESGLEVDFCVNNRLGVRNTLLLLAYSKVDPRVCQLGWLVKDWVGAHSVVGTQDGHLNSYAFMLLVIHYLQQCVPAVVPNLQMMAATSVPVLDRKWGYDDKWDTKFLEGISSLPASRNTQSLGELLLGFFHYYGHVFAWAKHAVCIRLNRERVTIDKFSLPTPTNDEQWYVEDPFDLRHNLAAKCTAPARQRLLLCFRESHELLRRTGDWTEVCPKQRSDSFLLRSRVSSAVTADVLLHEFRHVDLVRLYFPKTYGSVPIGTAFLEFGTAVGRRRAQTKNEITIAGSELCMLESSHGALQEALVSGEYSIVDVVAE